MIKEVIVVEGRDDVTAVKRAVDAEIISVSGFGINAKTIERIREAQKRKGVIVFTDPDYAGEKIRRIISKRVQGIKHAYIDKEEGLKDGDIGVENASPEAILNALTKAKAEIGNKREEFAFFDMISYGLTGDAVSSQRRKFIGKELRIGFCNAKIMLSRLNNYGIDRNELEEALKKFKGVSKWMIQKIL